LSILPERKRDPLSEELDVLCDADFFFWLNSQPSWLFRVFNPGKHCFEFQLN
jgi:hypothetical protein